MRAIAFRVAEAIGSAPGAGNVNYNWMEPARTIKIRVDQDQPAFWGKLTGSRPGSEHGSVWPDSHADAQRHLSRVDGAGQGAASADAAPHGNLRWPPLHGDLPDPVAGVWTDCSPRPDRVHRLAGRSIRWSGAGTRLPTVTVQAEMPRPAFSPPRSLQALAPKIAVLRTPACPAATIPEVGGSGRGEQQSAGVSRRHPASNVGPGAHGADGAAPKLQPPFPRHQRGPSGPHRESSRPSSSRTSPWVSAWRSWAMLALTGMIARNSP